MFLFLDSGYSVIWTASMIMSFNTIIRDISVLKFDPRSVAPWPHIFLRAEMTGTATCNHKF